MPKVMYEEEFLIPLLQSETHSGMMVKRGVKLDIHQVKQQKVFDE
jgi:hypothetical protein